MTRIQRARALRLGVAVAALLWPFAAQAYKPSAKERACSETAWLHYHLAESVGKDADAAWEDAIETCMWAGTKWETTAAQRASERPAKRR